MNDAPLQNATVLQELKVTAHMMKLESGVFCLFQSPSHAAPEPSGLPGVRVSLPPGLPPGLAPGQSPVEIVGFNADGWVGEFRDALLVRVRQPTAVLVTIYQRAGDQARPPNLQVMRVGNMAGVPQQSAPTAEDQGSGAPGSGGPGSGQFSVPLDRAEVSAHIQSRGDVGAMLGAWLGEPGSKRWMEGYRVKPPEGIPPDELEYQSVLGRGWMSPWVTAGEFCGSRGMALPILGLRVRLRGAAEQGWRLTAEASFVDGARAGPVGSGDLLEAPTLAPLEAFMLRFEPAAAAPKAAAEPPPPDPPDSLAGSAPDAKTAPPRRVAGRLRGR